MLCLLDDLGSVMPSDFRDGGSSGNDVVYVSRPANTGTHRWTSDLGSAAKMDDASSPIMLKLVANVVREGGRCSNSSCGMTKANSASKRYRERDSRHLGRVATIPLNGNGDVDDGIAAVMDNLASDSGQSSVKT